MEILKGLHKIRSKYMVLEMNRERILNLNLNLTLSMVKNQSKVEYTQKSCIHFVEVNYNH